MKINTTASKIEELKHLFRDTPILGRLSPNLYKWKQNWVCIRTIEDTQIAIDYYIEMPNFDAYNGGYLYIYGLLQALYLQQDALSNLHKTLFGIPIKYHEEYPDLDKIRQIRNNSIGHPSGRRNNVSFHTINQVTITKKSFQLLSHFENENFEYPSINLEEIIKIQNELKEEILKKIFVKVKLVLEEHILTFKNKKLITSLTGIDIVVKQIMISIENYNFVDSTKQLELFLNHWSEFKIGITERYFDDPPTGVRGYIDSINERLDFIREIIKNNNDDNNFQVKTILLDFEKEIIEIQEIAAEIDNEFSS